MVTPAEMLTILQCVATFVFERGLHTDLVALLPVHSVLRSRSLLLQQHLDDTIRAALQFGGAWRVGGAQVLFHIRGGRRARLAYRRGQELPLDLDLLADVQHPPTKRGGG